ncbi:MAG: phosphonate metabolism transcriptional regulator PhnF [Alphaproteobacteria bacterium]
MTNLDADGALDRGAGITLWRQIEARLAQEIADGGFEPGAQLPTERTLADRFEVNRHTIRQALAALSERGLIRIEQGRGMFVQENVLDYVLGARTRFSEILVTQNRRPGGQLLRASDERQDLQIARELKLPPSSPLIELEILGEADGRPISVSGHYFPKARFDGLIEAYRRTGSITRALQGFGVQDYTRALTRITARLPGAEEARLLRQPRSRPLIVSEVLNVDGAGKPIEFGVARFAAERVRMVVKG